VAVNAAHQLLFWDGTSWQAETTGLGSGIITSLWGNDANNVWGAGYDMASSESLVEYWDGTVWSVAHRGPTGAYRSVTGDGTESGPWEQSVNRAA
jgi:hypothetical protein